MRVPTYSENPFIEGDEVICISDNFPYIEKYGGNGGATSKPKLNEILIVDEVLGQFIRFNKYDSDTTINWWKYDRFKKLTTEEMKFKNKTAIDQEQLIDDLNNQIDRYVKENI